MNRIVVRRASADAMRSRQAELADFERGFVYPLGHDFFRIDHGANYLAFFRALGEPSPWLAELDGRVVGLLIAVRRQLAGRRVWYVCDLKVAATALGRGIARRLLRAWSNAEVDARDPAFAVSMDAADGNNRLVTLAARCPTAGPILTTRLALFSLDFATWQRTAPLLARASDPLGFRDLHGTKDIVLTSTGTAMPLLHLQHGLRSNEGSVPARAGATHMFCLTREHALVESLRGIGVVPHATASLLHRHLSDVDWNWLSTSDV